MLITLNENSVFPDTIFANNSQDTIQLIDQVIVSANVEAEVTLKYEDGTPIMNFTTEVDKTEIIRSSGAISNLAKGKDIRIELEDALESGEEVVMYVELKRLNVPT